jgi:hypothetical protein
LLRLTEISHPTLYRRLAEHARAGRMSPVSRGPLARDDHRGAATVSDRLKLCLISRLASASARKRAYTPAEANAETNTPRPRAPDDRPGQAHRAAWPVPRSIWVGTDSASSWVSLRRPDTPALSWACAALLGYRP